MALLNEKNEQLNIENVKAELKSLNKNVAVSEAELEAELEKYYHQALQLSNSKDQFKANFSTATDASLFPSLGGGILEIIKKALCAILNGASTIDDIIEAILKVIPDIFGVFILGIAKKLAQYLINIGINNFCAV